MNDFHLDPFDYESDDSENFSFDPTLPSYMRTQSGRETPEDDLCTFVSGTRHPCVEDLRSLTDAPETGALVLPSAMPLLNTNPARRLSREPLYGMDVVLQSEDRSRHVIAFGPTGAGKNVRVLNMFRVSSIRDPRQTTVTFSLKASDYAMVEAACRAVGKKMVVVNLNDAWRSAGWNPLATNDADVANDLIVRFADSVRNPLSHDSEFWTQWVKVGLKGAWQAGYRSFPAIYELFSRPRKELLPELKSHDNTESLQLADFLTGDSANAQTVLASIVGALSCFLSQNVMRVMSKDELKLPKLLKEPVCLHIEMPETSLETQRVLYQMLARTIIDELINVSEQFPHTAAPATIFLDDAPSLGRLLSPNRLLTLRSRGIGVIAGVQSLASLELVYGETSQALIDNFHTKIILPGGPARDAAYFAESSGEQMVGLPTFEGRATTFTNRPLLSSAAIRTPSYSHPAFGMPSTIMVGATTFQAYLQRSYEHPSIAGLLRSSRHVTGRERLRKRRLSLPVKPKKAGGRRVDDPKSKFTNVKGWSERQIRRRLKKVLEKLDWDSTTGSARKWWEEFEKENKHRLHLVLRFAEELIHREATITEFFLAYVYSNTDNIQANLHYLDYSRIKKREEKEKRESTQEAAGTNVKKKNEKLKPPGVEEHQINLTGYQENKISVIRVIYKLTGRPLRDIKELVEAAPCVVGSCASQDFADVVVWLIEEAGGIAYSD